MPETFAVEFPGRSVAKAVRVDAEDELPDAVAALGLRPRPTLVLVGGAGGLSGDDSDALKSLFVETVAPLVGELGAQVVDGATDAGVMRLLGRARHDLRLDFPLIGVAARENVAMPGAPAAPDAAPLEPNHSHFVLVGGAGGLSGDDSDALKSLFVETVAPLVGELGAQVVDGATDAGVMRLLGRARHDLGLDFPLIGVAARENVAMPGAPAQGDAAPLEPNHSHFVLVAGSGWGSESPWIARFAATLAGEERSATLLVHGGDIAWTDAAESVADERTVVTVVGSGGTADALAAKADPRARPLTSSGLVVAAEDGALAPLLRELLGGTA